MNIEQQIIYFILDNIILIYCWIYYALHWSFPGVSDVWSILLPFFTTASQKGEESWYISGAKWSSLETHTGEYKINIHIIYYATFH